MRESLFCFFIPSTPNDCIDINGCKSINKHSNKCLIQSLQFPLEDLRIMETRRQDIAYLLGISDLKGQDGLDGQSDEERPLDARHAIPHISVGSQNHSLIAVGGELVDDAVENGSTQQEILPIEGQDLISVLEEEIGRGCRVAEIVESFDGVVGNKSECRANEITASSSMSAESTSNRQSCSKHESSNNNDDDCVGEENPNEASGGERFANKDIPKTIAFTDEICAENKNLTEEKMCPKSKKTVYVPYIPPEADETEDKLFQFLGKGENFDKLTDCVELSGNDFQMEAIEKFEEAKVPPEILENIRKSGYTSLTPIQKWSIPLIMKGRDVLACAQTGSGKTAAFVIPVLSMLMNDNSLSTAAIGRTVSSPIVLVISPTRELAIQIHNEIRKFAFQTPITSTCMYGGVDKMHQFQMLQRNSTVLVATVGRIRGSANEGKIDLSCVKFLIIDEADKMLDLGFYDEVAYVASSCLGMPDGKKQTLLFSATFPIKVQELACDILSDYIFVSVGMLGEANRDIEQVVWKVDGCRKKEKLIEVLKEIGSDKVIVFLKEKRMADILCISIGELLDLPITAVHGDLSQREREEAVGFFRRSQASVLMATSIAARGLDIQGVRHIINYDLPSDVVEYVHRIGRTARCGHRGRALSFFSFPRDLKMARPLIKVLRDAHQEVPAWLVDMTSPRYVPRRDFMRSTDGSMNGEFPMRKTFNNPAYNARRKPASVMQQTEENEWS